MRPWCRRAASPNCVYQAFTCILHTLIRLSVCVCVCVYLHAYIYNQERRWGESDMGGQMGPVPDHAACPRRWQHTGAGTRPWIASRRRPYDAKWSN